MTISSQDAFVFLSQSELKSIVPSAFKEVEGHKSNEYFEINTVKALSDLETWGWKPVFAYQVTPKLECNIGIQKHFIHLRNESHYVGKKNAITSIPEIVIVNSYDGKSSFKLFVSIYRVVSKNRLVIHSSNLKVKEDSDSNLKHKHIRNTDVKDQNDIRLLFQSIEPNLTLMLNYIKELSSIIINQSQKKHLGQECCRARWDYKYKLLYPQELIKAEREEDEAVDLWTVYNRIHEKIIKGGWKGSGGRSVKLLVDPNRSLNVNIKLFHILESFSQKLNKIK